MNLEDTTSSRTFHSVEARPKSNHRRPSYYRVPTSSTALRQSATCMAFATHPSRPRMGASRAPASKSFRCGPRTARVRRSRRTTSTGGLNSWAAKASSATTATVEAGHTSPRRRVGRDWAGNGRPFRAGRQPGIQQHGLHADRVARCPAQSSLGRGNRDGRDGVRSN